MAEPVKFFPRGAIAQFRLVAEREQRFLAPGLLSGLRDGDHLIDRKIGLYAFARRVRESAVMADVAAKLGERDEDLARIGQRAPMRSVAPPGSRAKQRADIVDTNEISGLFARKPAGMRKIPHQGADAHFTYASSKQETR